MSRVIRRGALLAALVLLGGVGGSARAAGPAWLPPQTIEQNQNPIDGLSCASPTTCVAASSNPVVQDNALSFEKDPDPSSTLNAVSCAKSMHFCMFVDNNGGAFAYSGGHFGNVADIDGNVELDSVSCPSSSFCMAIDHDNVVFNYLSGHWDSGTPLTLPMGDMSSNFVNVSCVSSAFCVALVATDAGELYYTWDGSTWSSASLPFDTNAAYVVSLSCTATNFCLETDDIGQASVFTGSGWSTPDHIDKFNGQPVLYSACVDKSCVAVDSFGGFFHSDDGTTWTNRVGISGMQGVGVSSLACATATLCVAGGGEGVATTYAVPPGAAKPVLAGTPGVGRTLTLAHAHVQTSPVWYDDDWRRCANPDATCTLNPISKSPTGYTLTTADAHKYIDVREVIGFGFDEEGPRLSNIVGPIAPKPGTAKLVGSVTTTRAGVVTISLRCTGGPCAGTVRLTFHGTPIGSARYSIAAGQTGKVKITLNATGKNQLGRHSPLTVKLVITPRTGTPTTVAITLKASS